MFLSVVVSVACLLPRPVASAWADALSEDNTRLLREVEKLELDVMEQRYQAGLSVRVAETKGVFSQVPEHRKQRLQEVMRTSGISFEAFAKLIMERADLKRLLLAGELEALSEELERLCDGGTDRLWNVGRGRFPVLTKLVRENRGLVARKQRAEAELKQLRGGPPVVFKL